MRCRNDASTRPRNLPARSDRECHPRFLTARGILPYPPRVCLATPFVTQKQQRKQVGCFEASRSPIQKDGNFELRSWLRTRTRSSADGCRSRSGTARRPPGRQRAAPRILTSKRRQTMEEGEKPLSDATPFPRRGHRLHLYTPTARRK